MVMMMTTEYDTDKRCKAKHDDKTDHIHHNDDKRTLQKLLK